MAHLRLVFGVLVLVSIFCLTPSQPVLSEVDTDTVSYLFSTRGVLYYKKENTKYTLANESSLVHENFDYHYAKGLAFFQPDIATIASVPLLQQDGTPAATVVRVDTAANEMVSVFAVDWVHDRVLWSTFGYDRRAQRVKSTVASADLRGGDARVLRVTNTTVPSSMAVDPYAGKLFWINDLVNIASCNLDGTDYKLILKVDQNIDVVTRLTLDLAARRVFYIETENSAVSGRFFLNSVDYDGEHKESLYILDKTTENTRRDIRSIDFVQGRLFVFSGMYEKNTDKVKSFVLHSLRNATVEGKRVMFSDESKQQAGSESSLPTLHARLVLPELQPAMDPKCEMTTVASNSVKIEDTPAHCKLMYLLNK